MMHQIDKRDRAREFRHRLGLAMTQAGVTQAALARGIGVDRSTISQLLKGLGARLPNAQVVAECARVLGISADWLLGLTERPESAAELMAESLLMLEAPRALADENLIAWHREAVGYKVRHVPATLPDLVKTRAVLEWEYEPTLGRTADQAISTTEEHLDWMRSSGSDYEIALPLHELTSLFGGTGYWFGLSREARAGQIMRILELHEKHYPSLRIFLFDARRVFSAPITIFGPLRAVIYLGRNYIVFRDRERVRGMTAHFDWLVREAEVQANDVGGYLEAMQERFGL